MRFKLDENLPVELAADLRLAGHEADTVADEGLEGTDDVTVVAAAFLYRRVLLTLDKDIANPIHHPKSTHAGVILFRPGTSGRQAVREFVRSRLEELPGYDLDDHVTVVSEQRIRIR